MTGLVTAAFMPLVFLSGLFFPLDIAPAWMKTVSAVVPSTYMADALRQVMVGATPQFSLGIDVAAMADGRLPGHPLRRRRAPVPVGVLPTPVPSAHLWYAV
jgi:ABC-2 type transporter